jgi:hypothetical protein
VIPYGDGPGWYLVPTAADRDGLPDEWLAGAEMVFRQRGSTDRPGYAVYRWPRQPALEGVALVQEAWSSPALSPGPEDAVAALDVPLEMDGQVEFLGYNLSSLTAEQGGEIALTTAWRVTRRPSEPALSQFAHLVDSAGAVSVGDAMGYPPVQWSPSDVFVQRSTLPIPADAAPGRYWVQVGLYSLLTGDRLSVAQEGKPASDRLLLASVSIGNGNR